jgi:hypothetical protein
MKQIKVSLLTFLVALTVFSCSNDVDIITYSEPLLFVYSIVNPDNEAQYIRVQRTFIGEEPARIMAQKYDSIYPSNIVVNAFIYKSSSTPEMLQAYPTLEIAKDSGFFQYQRHVLYELKLSDWKSCDSIRIQVIDTLNAKTVEGSTRISKAGLFIRPTSYSNQISFYGANYGIKWLPGISHYNSLGFVFHYREYSESQEFHKSFIFQLQQVFNADTIQDYSLSLDELMYVISTHIQDNGDITVRWMDSIDLCITTCERFLFEYSQIQTYNPSESALIYFTNISNGSGIISSKVAKTRSGLFLDRIGLDSLKYGRFTKHLLFSKYQ